MPPGGRPPVARTGWMLAPILRDEVAIAMPAVLAERSLVVEAGAFDQSLAFCSDHDLWIRLATRAQGVALTAPLTKVRAHGANSTLGRDIEAYEQLKRVYRKLLNELTDEHLCLLARHRYARALISLAALYRNAGRPLPALRALRDALRFRPVHKAWWGALARTLVRPLIPDCVMSRYYTWRRTSAPPARGDRTGG